MVRIVKNARLALTIAATVDGMLTDGRTTVYELLTQQLQAIDGITIAWKGSYSLDASHVIDLRHLSTENVGPGAGEDALGKTFTVANIVVLIIRNLSTSTARLIFEDGGSRIPISPGGAYSLFAPEGTPISDGCEIALDVENDTGHCDCEVTILGN